MNAETKEMLQLLQQATSEIARLRAEANAKDQRIATLEDHGTALEMKIILMQSEIDQTTTERIPTPAPVKETQTALHAVQDTLIMLRETSDEVQSIARETLSHPRINERLRDIAERTHCQDEIDILAEAMVSLGAPRAAA